MAISPVDRILAHVVKRGGHWLFQGAHDREGYGIIRTGSRTDGTRRDEYVQDVMFRHYKGPIPKGYQVDHICHVTNCVNPAHLRAVPQRTNLSNRRGYAPVGSRS